MPLWTWFDKSFPEYYARLDKVYRKTCSKKFSCVDFYTTSGTGKFVWHKKIQKTMPLWTWFDKMFSRKPCPYRQGLTKVFQKTMPLQTRFTKIFCPKKFSEVDFYTTSGTWNLFGTKSFSRKPCPTRWDLTKSFPENYESVVKVWQTILMTLNKLFLCTPVFLRTTVRYVLLYVVLLVINCCAKPTARTSLLHLTSAGVNAAVGWRVCQPQLTVESNIIVICQKCHTVFTTVAHVHAHGPCLS
jgi:hypothetical protein